MFRTKGMMILLFLAVLLVAVGCSGGDQQAPYNPYGPQGYGANCGGIPAGYTQLPEGPFYGELPGMTMNYFNDFLIGNRSNTNGFPSSLAVARTMFDFPELQYYYPVGQGEICLSSNALNSSTPAPGQIYWDGAQNLRVLSVSLRGLLPTQNYGGTYGYGTPGYPQSQDRVEANIQAYLMPNNRLSGQAYIVVYGRHPYTGQPTIVFTRNYQVQ